MSRWTTAAPAMLVAALTACAVGACGSSSSSSAGSAKSANAAKTSPATTAAAATTTAAVAATTAAAATTTAAASSSAPALTKPGTTLKVGQTAHVQWDAGTGPEYSFAITVSSIAPGSMSDFKDVSLTGVPKGAIPTYVKVSITNTGTRPLKTSVGDPAYDMGANGSDGLDDALSLVGDFPPCPQVDSPKVYLPGQTYSTCQIYMERGGAREIGYDGSEATLDTPILWSAS